MRTPLPTALLLALCLPAAGRALEWKQTTVSATTQPFQKSLVLEFVYANTGRTPVTIGDIQTNCDCITVIPGQTVCAPGATGKLIATFIVGERFGRYERTITVTTSDSPAPVKLRVDIDSPELVEFAPRSVEWSRGGPAQEQTVEITVVPGLALDFTEVFAINSLFSYHLETVEAGHRYRLRITPGSTAREANTAIRLVGQDRAGHRLVVSAYANVR